MYLAHELIIRVVSRFRTYMPHKPYARSSENISDTALLLARPNIRCSDTAHLALIISSANQKQSRERSLER